MKVNDTKTFIFKIILTPINFYILLLNNIYM